MLQNAPAKNTTPRTDDELLEEHAENTRQVAVAVAGLLPRFARQGMTPLSILEGAVRGGALAMALGQNETPQAIADWLEEYATVMRTLAPDVFQPKRH